MYGTEELILDNPSRRSEQTIEKIYGKQCHYDAKYTNLYSTYARTMKANESPYMPCMATCMVLLSVKSLAFVTIQ